MIFSIYKKLALSEYFLIQVLLISTFKRNKYICSVKNITRLTISLRTTNTVSKFNLIQIKNCFIFYHALFAFSTRSALFFHSKNLS